MESTETPRESLQGPLFQRNSVGEGVQASKNGGFEPVERVKSSLRLQYEAQVKVIRSQIGDLEKVRENLGLSQRKIAQLLLVDPSAWTRWTRTGEEAPPHIWRSLQWYLSLQEKNPSISPAAFLFAGARFPQEKALQKLEDEAKAHEDRVRQLESGLEAIKARQISATDHRKALERIDHLQEETRRLRRWLSFWMMGTAALGLSLFWLVRV